MQPIGQSGCAAQVCAEIIALDRVADGGAAFNPDPVLRVAADQIAPTGAAIPNEILAGSQGNDDPVQTLADGGISARVRADLVAQDAVEACIQVAEVYSVVVVAADQVAFPGRSPTDAVVLRAALQGYAGKTISHRP